MELVKLLDKYHFARFTGQKGEQLEIADLLVDSYIPELLEQLKTVNDPLGH